MISKRLRITKNGKIMRRRMAVDHFRAKKSGQQIRNKRKSLQMHPADAKVIKQLYVQS